MLSLVIGRALTNISLKASHAIPSGDSRSTPGSRPTAQ